MRSVLCRILRSYKDTPHGPSDWIRTSGLLNPIQARYQTSPHPDIFFFTAVGVTQAAYIDYHRPQENASLFFNFFNLFFRGNQPVQNSLSPLRRKAFSCCHLQEDREAPGGRTHERDKRNPRQTAGISAKSKNYSSMSITTLFPRCFHTAERKNPRLTAGVSQRGDYSSMSMTTPEPTVRPPSRMAKRRPFSMAMGVISSTFMSTLSPGMHISVPSGRVMMPVTSVVRK